MAPRLSWGLISSVDPGKGTSNNYAYLVVDEKSRDAVIIDPANPPEYNLSKYLCVMFDLTAPTEYYRFSRNG